MNPSTSEAEKQQRNGFTLIELLVVIFIIGVLTALLLSNMLGARQRSEDIAKKNDLIELKKALQLYYNDYQSYPAATMVGGVSVIEDVNEEDSVFEDNSGTVYMKQLPSEYQYFLVGSNAEDFRLIVDLDNLSDEEIANSQIRCPLSVGGLDIDFEPRTTYVVCRD